MRSQFTILFLALLLALFASWYLLPETWARILLRLGRRTSGLRSRNITVDGLDWHYLSGGRGPVLLAIHGFGGDADHFLGIAPYLRRHFRILAPDLIGFGASDPGDGLPFDIDAQVDRLARLLTRLDVRPCVIAGSSMGGWIAARYAQRYPEQLQALWLLAPLGVGDGEAGELLKRIEDGEDSPLNITTIDEFEQRVFGPMFARPPRLPRPLRVHYGRHAVARAAASRRMFPEIIGSQPKLERIAENLSLPVLIQWGTRDRAVALSGADRLESALTSGKVLVLEGVGHLPMLESARRTARQFRDFARKEGLITPGAGPARPESPHL